MVPALEVLPAIRRAAFFNVLWSIVAFVLGLVLLAVGFATGCVLCVAIPLTIGSVLAGLYWLVILALPTLRLGHLGEGPAREQVIRELEAQTRADGAFYRELKSGKVWLTRDFLVVFSGGELLIERLRDVLLSYPQITNHTRYGITTRTSHQAKVRSRSQDYTFEIEPAEAEWLPRLIASATPHAFAGFDQRLVNLDRAQLAAEVDRRAPR